MGSRPRALARCLGDVLRTARKHPPNNFFQNARLSSFSPSPVEMPPSQQLPAEIVFFVRTRTAEPLPLPRAPSPAAASCRNFHYLLGIAEGRPARRRRENFGRFDHLSAKRSAKGAQKGHNEPGVSHAEGCPAGG